MDKNFYHNPIPRAKYLKGYTFALVLRGDCTTYVNVPTYKSNVFTHCILRRSRCNSIEVNDIFGVLPYLNIASIAGVNRDGSL